MGAAPVGRPSAKSADSSARILACPEGATWRRVDLHLHSPGVREFACPPGSSLDSEPGKRAVVTSYVQQLADTGIRVGAITDYNGIRTEWFKLIRDEARQRDIMLLPGAELAIQAGKHGLHVLTIYAESTDLDEVNRFLNSLDEDPATPLFSPSRDGGHRDIRLRGGLGQAFRELRERFGCLIIVPHPDATNGLMKSLQAQAAAEFLTSVRVDAVEHCGEDDLRRLQSSAALNPAVAQRLARVEFSDPKSIDEIGTKQCANGTPRVTYMKLSSTDLDALRLAIHDPETRLVVGVPPEADHTRILGIDVEGPGFLGNLTIRWSDDLNTLIGGRGVGKSAVLETLRYALGAPAYTELIYRSDLVRYALGSGGRVTVLIERRTGRSRHRYSVSRVLGEEPRVEDLDSGQVIDVTPMEVFGPFPPIVFGQREIQAVSADEGYRLRLVDEIVGEDARRAAREVARVKEALDSNGRAILTTLNELAKKEEYEQRLNTLRHEIDVYEREGVAHKLGTHMNLSSDGRVVQRALNDVGDARNDWSEASQDLVNRLREIAASLRRGKSVYAGLLAEAAVETERATRELEALADQGTRSLASLAARLEDRWRQWQGLLKPLEEDLLRIRRELHSETLDPDRLLSLTDEAATLEPLLSQLKGAESRLAALKDQRTRLLQEYRDRRHDEHAQRRAKCEEVERWLAGRLRLSVLFKAQKEDYKRDLAGLLRGSGVSSDAIDRMVKPEATDGFALAQAVRAGVTEVQRQFDLTASMAQKVVDWLTADPGRLLALETLMPADSVRVELFVEDANASRPLDRLSVGQRATAMLLLLFAIPGRPLILDQPEDDLDNRFIYKDIVALLREHKGVRHPGKRRQIIAATHNANIPVLGDAELVLTLEASEQKAKIVTRASIDDRGVRDSVKRVLEGGEEAFRRRAEKYGGPI